MIRTSKVKFLKVHSVGITSTLQIGDVEEIIPKVKILAVQRYLSLFSEMKAHLIRKISLSFSSRYHIYHRKPASHQLFSMRFPSFESEL